MKFRSLFDRGLQDDINDELASHIAMKAEELEAEGMAPADAEREARKSFGNYTRMVENTREVHLFSLLDSLGQDIRYGLRRLWREPAFTLAAIFTLALVIGANGAIFSVFEAVLLRALPFEDPGRLVVLSQTDGKSTSSHFSIPDFEDLRTASALSGVAAEQTQSVNLTGVAEPGRLVGDFVSSSFFPLLGVRPALGRGFTPQEDTAGAAHVCILNHFVWRDKFGSDPGVLGRTLILNAQPYTVIGILPESFQPVLTNSEVWIPLPFYPNYSRDRNAGVVSLIARLAPGATVTQARAEMTVIAERSATQRPAASSARRIVTTSLHESVTGFLRNVVLLLAGAVGCVLLIGCVNIAGLLLTKATGRRQEIAIRISLGAGKPRLIRQLLTEALLLSAMGGALGLCLAVSGMRLLTHYCADLLNQRELALNPAVLGYLAGISLLAGLLFGIAPAFLAQRQNTLAMRQRGGAKSQGHLGDGLVATQVALSLVLLVGAGLLVTSVMNVAAIDPGFHGEKVLSMEYRVPVSKYSTGPQQTQIHYEIAARVGALPGVESAAIIGALPFSGNANRRSVTLPDRPAPRPGEAWIANFNPVSPALFRTLGIPLLAGRDFNFSDTGDSAPVAIVSQGFADRFWPHESPLGRQVNFRARAGNPDTRTIVGVVANIKQEGLDDGGTLQIYNPYSQEPFIFATLAVKTKGEPLAMTRAVQQAIWSADKDQPMWKIRTLQSLVDRSFSIRRYLAWLVGGFSGLALILAAVGLYGLLAYAVSQRTSEFGIRLAIGATPADISRLVLRRGLLLTATGLMGGVAASLYLAPLIRTQIYEVSATDPTVYACLCAVLLVVALPAILLPARRAMRIDPATALRQE